MISLFFSIKINTLKMKVCLGTNEIHSNIFSSSIQHRWIFKVSVKRIGTSGESIVFVRFFLLVDIRIVSFRFIVALLIVVICLLNVVGVCLYDKKRRKFLHQEEKEEIPMTDSSSSSTTTPTMKYRQMSTPSARSEVFSTATFLVQPSIQQSNPSIQAKSSKSLFSLNTILEKSEMDLELEEFQRQALAEHNTMRKMYRKPPVKLCEALNLYAQVKKRKSLRNSVDCFFPSLALGRTLCSNKRRCSFST